MRERPIIFNADMVRAVLDGRKTQTRRIMTPQPADDIQLHKFPNKSLLGWLSSLEHKHGSFTAHICPFGQLGDRLWVREAFQGPLVSEDLFDDYRAYPDRFETPEYCEYAADGGPRPEYCDLDDNLRHGWRPSIHMPRWASRITLEITGVRVERLQDISQSDAKSEGCWYGRGGGEPDFAVNPSDHFSTLWASIYGADSWRANPWVWVIEFKRVEGQ
jgi:hypothetical protein